MSATERRINQPTHARKPRPGRRSAQRRPRFGKGAWLLVVACCALSSLARAPKLGRSSDAVALAAPVGADAMFHSAFSGSDVTTTTAGDAGLDATAEAFGGAPGPLQYIQILHPSQGDPAIAPMQYAIAPSRPGGAVWAGASHAGAPASSGSVAFPSTGAPGATDWPALLRGGTGVTPAAAGSDSRTQVKTGVNDRRTPTGEKGVDGRPPPVGSAGQDIETLAQPVFDWQDPSMLPSVRLAAGLATGEVTSSADAHPHKPTTPGGVTPPTDTGGDIGLPDSGHGGGEQPSVVPLPAPLGLGALGLLLAGGAVRAAKDRRTD